MLGPIPGCLLAGRYSAGRLACVPAVGKLGPPAGPEILRFCTWRFMCSAGAFTASLRAVALTQVLQGLKLHHEFLPLPLALAGPACPRPSSPLASSSPSRHAASVRRRLMRSGREEGGAGKDVRGVRGD